MENSGKIQTKSRDAGLFIVVIMLIVITMISSSIGLFAWAKYISSQSGNATAPIAKWHFNLKTGEYTLNGPQLLTLTRTDNYTHVEEGKLAPGTSGVLPIIVDTTGTETDLTYDVIITINNCPQNIVFTPQTPASTTVTTTGDGTAQSPRVRTIKISKYIPYANVGEHDETITWNWPYETGTGNTVITNDVIDTADSGKEVTVTITATGTEVLEAPISINVGDSVQYTPSSIKTYTWDYSVASSNSSDTVDLKSGAEQQYNISDWYVYSVNGDNIAIVPKTPSYPIKLHGAQGYNNMVKLLNDACSTLYSDSSKGITARSINLTDIENVIDPTTLQNRKDSYRSGWASIKYGERTENAFTNYKDYPEIYASENKSDIDGNEITGLGQSEQITSNGDTVFIYKNAANYNEGKKVASTSIHPYQTFYTFNLKTALDSVYQKVLLNNQTATYWIASRGIDLHNDYSDFYAMAVWGGYIDGQLMFWSAGGDNYNSFGLFPIVYLNVNNLEKTNTAGSYRVK